MDSVQWREFVAKVGREMFGDLRRGVGRKFVAKVGRKFSSER